MLLLADYTVERSVEVTTLGWVALAVVVIGTVGTIILRRWRRR